MSDSNICIIHKVGKETCSWSNKKADGAFVTFDDGSVKNQFLSWSNLKKLLAFKMKGTGK